MKYTLVYSRRHEMNDGSNKAINLEGKTVNFTNKLVAHKNWRSSYRWEDAVEVGTINDDEGIISYGIQPKELL